MKLQSFGPGSKALLLLAAAAIVAAGLKLGAPIMVPLLLAACIAIATAPVVGLFERKGLPTPLAVTGAIVVVLAALFGFGMMLSVAASDFAETLPAFERELVGAQQQIASWLQAHSFGRLAATVSSYDPAAWAGNVLESAVFGAAPVISGFGVVLFVVIFTLLEAATFRDKLACALGSRPDRAAEASHIVGEVQRYLLVKTGLNAVAGVAAGLWCYVMGLSDAVLWGVVAFLLHFIPVFGSVISAIPPVLAALVMHGPATSFGVLMGYVVFNNVIGNLIEPKIMGRSMGLSPLVVTISIVVWGWILGPVGALLSVPLTMIAKIVFAHFEDTHWLAVLLGPGNGNDEKEYVRSRPWGRLRPRSSSPSAPAKPPAVGPPQTCP